MSILDIVASVVVLGLAASMTADLILDSQKIWMLAGEDKQETPPPVSGGRGSSRIAALDWVMPVEEFPELPSIEVGESLIESFRGQLKGIRVKANHAVDYSKLTIRELKALASRIKLKGYGTMKKADLVVALSSMG